MIKEISKNAKGVTLISLVIAILIITTLTNVVIFNAQDALANTKLERLQSDISNLRDRVSEYYANYGTIPTLTEYSNIEHIQEAGLISQTNDIGKFYVIGLSKLENLILNYGKDYEKVTIDMATDQVNTYTDLYIINETSHNIFYVAGVKVHQKWHYTDYNAEDVDKAAVDLRYIDNVKIPDGYKYVSGAKETGIIIQDNEEKQYVWVPVENYEEFETIDENSIIAENQDEKEAMLESVKANKGFYIATEESAAISTYTANKKENTDVVQTICYDEQVNAVERWISEDEEIAKTINYTSGNLKNRIALYLTNEEKWSSIYQSQDGKELKYKDKDGNEVYIPNGFQVSEQEGSNKVNEGLVIKNAITQDRYVWISVPKSVFKTAKSEDDYEEIKKDLEEYTIEYNEEKSKGTSENTLEENEIETDETTIKNINNTNIAKYTDTYFEDCGLASEKEYYELKNTMLSSIYRNKGFWISQYEIGSSSISQNNSDTVERNATSQEGQYAYNYVTPAEAQKIATNMASGEKTSSLLFGIQWDLACKFITENAKKDVTSSSEWANYSNSTFALTKGEYNRINYIDYTEVTKGYNKIGAQLLTTGATIRNSTLNIYDLAGNVAEWTLEQDEENASAVARGGSFIDENGAAINRTTGTSNQSIGFRVAIY